MANVFYNRFLCGWHLPGLCNVKETALSFVAQTPPYEDRGNLATMSPAGLNILRCHEVLPHTLDCTTERCQERKFFLSGMWLAPFKVAHRLHVYIQQRFRHCLHEASAAETGFNIQGSTAGFSFSSAKRNTALNHNQVLSTVWKRCILCVTDCCCYKYLLYGREVWCLIQKI